MSVSITNELDRVPTNVNHTLPGLDGLRGIAILLVMVFHLASMKPVTRIDRLFYLLREHCWGGVDLFFVLSGFLITGILIDTKGTKNYFSNFYARRALRILPLYYAFLAGLLLLYPLVGGEKVAREAVMLQRNQLWIWTHTVNWLVAITGDFVSTAPLGTGGFWSVSIEEQFYLVWPFVVLQLSRKKLLQFSLALVIAATIIRLAMAEMGASWAAIYTVTFARMDAISMGAIIAIIARSSGGLGSMKRFAPFIAVFAISGLALIQASIHSTYRLSDNYILAIRCTLFVWLWAATLICTLTAGTNSFLKILTHSRFLAIFGKFSFSLYLFHGHLYRIFDKLGFDAHAGVTIGGSVLPWQMLYLATTISTSLLIAYLTWHLYEKHFLKLKALFSTKTQFPSAVVPAVPATVPLLGEPHNVRESNEMQTSDGSNDR